MRAPEEFRMLPNHRTGTVTKTDKATFVAQNYSSTQDMPLRLVLDGYVKLEVWDTGTKPHQVVQSFNPNYDGLLLLSVPAGHYVTLRLEVAFASRAVNWTAY